MCEKEGIGVGGCAHTCACVLCVFVCGCVLRTYFNLVLRNTTTRIRLRNRVSGPGVVLSQVGGDLM